MRLVYPTSAVWFGKLGFVQWESMFNAFISIPLQIVAYDLKLLFLKVNFKKLLKNYLSTLDNWDNGKYREVELKGHTQNVLCVCLENRKTQARLASGMCPIHNAF